MDAHVSAEAKRVSVYGSKLGGNAPVLSHLVLSEPCLRAFGVPTAPLSAGADFYVEVQIRFHGCAGCTRWSRAFATYVPTRALDRLLLPDLGRGNGTGAVATVKPFHIAYECGADWGGLFLSVPVYCDDAKLTYDGFTTVAIRVAIPSAAAEFYELLMTYDEVVEPRTRFGADGNRLAELARQLCVFSLPNDWSDVRKRAFGEITARLRTLLKSSEQRARLGASDYIDPPELIFDETHEEKRRGAELRRAVDTSVQTLKDAMSKSLKTSTDSTPEGRARSSQGSERKDSVAHGLLAVIKGAGSTASRIADSRYSDALLAGLEPPGVSRGGQHLRKRLPELESVVMAEYNDDARGRRVVPRSDDPPPGTLTVEDALKTACSLLADGGGAISPRGLWVFGGVSIVPKTDYNSGAPFLVVTYSGDASSGCRPLYVTTNRLSMAMIPMLDAMNRTGAADPTELPEAERAALVAAAPILGCVLSDAHAERRQLFPRLFSVDAEHRFLYDLQARCLLAFTAALKDKLSSLTADDRSGADRVNKRVTMLPQLVRYDIHVGSGRNGQWPERMAATVPGVIAAFCALLQTEKFCVFSRGAVWRSVIARLYTTCGGYVPFLAPVHADPTVYLFDYFRFGRGGITRVTSEPVVIRLERPRSGQLRECEIIAGTASPSHPWVTHKFLPGEFHSYLCLGFNSELQSLLLFPGGFGLEIDVAPAIDSVWDQALNEAVLDRYCRREPRATARAETNKHAEGCRCPSLETLTPATSPTS